jgi:LacI family transcriptional regulator
VVSSQSALARRARTVAVEHLPAPPAGESHQIALAAAAREPAVGEGVPRLMWVEPIAEPRLPSPLSDDLRDSTVGQAALSADPQPGQIGVGRALPHPDVPIEGAHRLDADRARTLDRQQKPFSKSVTIRAVSTIRDVARRAGVSIASVSRVVNEREGVGTEISERVRQAVSELGFQPNSVASSLKTARTHTLACVIPDICNPFFPELVRAVEDAARAAGYVTLLCNTDNDPDKEADYLQALYRRRVDGLILIPSHDEAPPTSLLHLIDRGTPVVIVDRRMDGFSSDLVLTDNRRGGRLAARHLLELGHRRIGILNRALDTSTARERDAGFRAELSPAGAYDPTLVRLGTYSLDSGRAMAADLLTTPVRPTAILAGNDLLAIGALQAAAAAGLRVPEDLSIVGFDGILLSQAVVPRLTTVAQPIYRLGELAVQLVLRPMDGTRRPRTHLLRPELQIGESTGTAP